MDHLFSPKKIDNPKEDVAGYFCWNGCNSECGYSCDSYCQGCTGSCSGWTCKGGCYTYG